MCLRGGVLGPRLAGRMFCDEVVESLSIDLVRIEVWLKVFFSSFCSGMRFCPPPRPNRFCCAWRASRSDIGAFLTGSGSGSGIFSGFGFFLECFEELDLMDFLDFRERMDTLSISISDSEDSDSKSEVSGFMLWDSRDALSELLEDHPCSEGSEGASDDEDSSFSVL